MGGKQDKINKESLKIAKIFSKAIRKKYKIEKLILFGSRARGDEFVTSDFDFIVVSSDFRGVKFTHRMAEMYKYWNEAIDVEPLCYTPKEFERKKKEIGIVRQAVKEGLEIN